VINDSAYQTRRQFANKRTELALDTKFRSILCNVAESFCIIVQVTQDELGCASCAQGKEFLHMVASQIGVHGDKPSNPCSIHAPDHDDCVVHKRLMQLEDYEICAMNVGSMLHFEK
jgi:hypothetical protein